MKIDKIVNDQIKEEMYHAKLDTGLNVFFVPKRGYNKQYAIFTTKYGSIDNIFTPIGEEEKIEVPEGIAHFLEHKLFEEPDGDIFDEFSKLGVDSNAFTSFDQTSYLFSSNDDFYEALKLLVKFVQNPYFTDESIEKEKGIIEQEISMYDDSPGWRVFFNAMDSMYYNHPIKIDIAGTKETIAEIDKDLLYRAYNTFYHPENMVLVMVGDIDFEQAMEVIEKNQRTDYKEMKMVDRAFVEEPKSIRQKSVEDKMVTANPIFCIGFKELDLGETGEELVRKDLVTNLMLDMIFSSSSEFYNELYDEGLIDSGFSAYYTGKETYGHTLLSGESEQPKLVYDRIVDFINKSGKDALSEKAFNRVKKNEIGSFLQGFNSIEFIATSYVDMYLSGYDLMDYLNLLESIRYEEIVEKFETHLSEDNMVLSTIYPK